VAGVHGMASPPPAVDDRVTHHAHPIGDGPTTDVAAGLTAVNHPGAALQVVPGTGVYYKTVPASAMATSIDLGLTAAGQEVQLLVGAENDGAQGGSIDLPYGGAFWTWGTFRHSIDPGFSGAPADGGTWFESSTNDGGRLGIAVLPLALPDPRVLVWSTAGFTLPDGSASHAVELPTFSDSNGHLLSVWQATGKAANAFANDATGVVVVGSDGQVVVEPCEQPSGSTCPQPNAVPGLAQAVQALGAAPAGAAAPTDGGPPAATPSVGPATSAAGVAPAVAPNIYAATAPWSSPGTSSSAPSGAWPQASSPTVTTPDA
jgi:hypothetical protein